MHCTQSPSSYVQNSTVAEKIYDLAANEIQAYINKAYGNKQENTLAQQMEDFHRFKDYFRVGGFVGLISIITAWASIVLLYGL